MLDFRRGEFTERTGLRTGLVSRVGIAFDIAVLIVDPSVPLHRIC